MEDLCLDCGNAHPPMTTCSESWRIFVQEFIRKIGRPDRCPEPCNSWIYWIRHLNGKTVPYTIDGKIHLGRCVGRYKEPNAIITRDRQSLR
jgi:hypothetical protein